MSLQTVDRLVSQAKALELNDLADSIGSLSGVLNLDSAEIVEFVLAIESEFQITIAEDDQEKFFYTGSEVKKLIARVEELEAAR
ncbi:MAG: hypothetical protein PW845_13685 [Pseudomonas sp.]|nr:hypothetical protein [Pseudomonas sp.]